MQHETFPKNSHDTHAPGQPDEIFPAQAEPVLSQVEGPVEAPVDLRSSAARQAQGERNGENPATDAYGRTPDRWTGSGDPDDPTAGLTDRECDIYWAGARDSMREDQRANAARLPSAQAEPVEAPLRQAQGERDMMASHYAHPDDALVRPWLDDLESGMRAQAVRESGWNPRRQRVFLEALADSGIVTQACRAAAISPRAAYNLRNRDAIFAEAWVAAQALARQRLADELLERALRGQADRIFKNGEVIAERHRTDNRLALGLLTRLDRQAEPDARSPYDAPASAPTPHKVLMAHWDQYLDTLAPVPPPPGGVADDPQDQRDHPQDGGGAPLETGSPADGNSDAIGHTREPVSGRCELHELVRTLEGSRDPAPEPATDPASPAEVEEDEHEVWQDGDGHWWTDFPPPEGFDGEQQGRYGDWDYQRELDEDEQFAVEEEDDEDRAERARRESLRRAAFGLPPEDEDEDDEDEEDDEDDETQIPPRTDQRDREAVEGHVTPYADIAKPGDSADTASPPADC